MYINFHVIENSNYFHLSSNSDFIFIIEFIITVLYLCVLYFKNAIIIIINKHKFTIFEKSF